MWKEAKSQAGAASREVEGMADSYFKSMGSDNRLDINKFSAILTKEQEDFFTPTPYTHPATVYMMNSVLIVL